MCEDVSVNSQESNSPEETRVEPEQDRPSFDLVLIRACVVAMWADGTMAAAERDALSQVIASVVRTQRDRDKMRSLALQDLNRHEVFQEIEQLEPAERLHLFDRCFAILKSDRKVKRRELRFLRELRKRCGVGYWAFERMVFRLVPGFRKLLLAVFVIGLVVAALLWRQETEVAVHPPKEAEAHPHLLLQATPPDLPALDAEQLYQQVRRSVVIVHVKVNGQTLVQGSGAVIGVNEGRSNYYVVTNRHVVFQLLESGQSLTFEVEFENGGRFDAALDYYSRDHDLALLAVMGMPLWAKVIPLTPRSQLAVGETVYALGSPMGLRHTLTSGLISALRPQHIQTDATVHSGSSGGPLLDSRGLLCGVVTSTHMTKDFSFAVYADSIIEMLDSRRGVFPPKQDNPLNLPT